MVNMPLICLQFGDFGIEIGAAPIMGGYVGYAVEYAIGEGVAEVAPVGGLFYRSACKQVKIACKSLFAACCGVNIRDKNKMQTYPMQTATCGVLAYLDTVGKLFRYIAFIFRRFAINHVDALPLGRIVSIHHLPAFQFCET